MSRSTADGKTSLWFVPSISNTAAPTAAEINAGVNLTPYLVDFDDGASGNDVDAAGLADVVDLKDIGTWGAKPKATLFRDDTTDTAWSTCARGSKGHYVLREFVSTSTAVASGQKVDVFKGTLQQPMKGAKTKNEMSKFSSEMAITAAPQYAVAVA